MRRWKTFAERLILLLVAGHKTKPPATITYASVISCDTICLGLVRATLNDLDVKAADIKHAYITAPCK